ncbi:MAG: transposase [Thermoplasmata archaeon]|nr:transposase [Thermoplasmata archaeon]
MVEATGFIYELDITDVGNMSGLPEWVRKHKKKGMAVEKRGDSYYLTRVTSVWDPEKKRARKVTLEYLGRITPEGVIPPKGKRPTELGGILDAGNYVYLENFARHLEGPLRQCFPDDWQSILATAAIKLCYGEPFRRMQLRHQTSLSKRLWPKAALSKNSLTRLLERLGNQWPAQREFFTKISREEKHMAIDLSHIFSTSKNIPWTEYGHNSDDIWRPQVGILLMWGTSTKRPGFLKLLPGATHSAQTLINAIWESDIQEVVVVVDKGFWSSNNLAALEEANLEYVMALRRDLPIVKHTAHNRYKKYFRYRGRVQWWHAQEWEGRTLYHYLDKTMAAEEESNYLKRVEAGQETMTRFRKLRPRFGTLTLLTDTGLSAEKTYSLYKERRDIEYTFDTLQNTLGADTTWMRTRESLQGYLFIQYIALHLYSQILDHLKRKDLLKRYSVQDILTHLSKATVVEIDGKDRIGEITRQTKKIIELLELPITERPGH